MKPVAMMWIRKENWYRRSSIKHVIYSCVYETYLYKWCWNVADTAVSVQKYGIVDTLEMAKQCADDELELQGLKLLDQKFEVLL